MKKYKIWILLVLIVLVLGLILILNNKKNNKEETKPNNIEARIPKLEVGVDVHALENKILEVLGPDNVAIRTDRSSGSGILWQASKRQLVIVTVAHLVSDFETGEVELWSGKTVHFQPSQVTCSLENDIAVVYIELEEKLTQAYSGVHAFPVEDMLEIGDKMWILDSKYGAGSGISIANVSAIDIFLEDYQANMLVLYGTGKTGMSGCPVYSDEGLLAGMVSGMSEDKTTLAIVPILQIMKFLETLEE